MENKNLEEQNFADEKYLTKKIEEETKALEKIKDDLIEQQEYKNALASKIRSFTTKLKTLEESVIQNSVEIEKFKARREKYISKIDRKDINLKIDKTCEEIFKGIFEQADPTDMDIEVEFEGTRTTFKISENPGAAISPNKDNIKQRVSTFRQSMKTSILNEQPKVPPKTFEDMKGIVAPFFSLSTDEFFFADEWGAVFLDNLPLRQTLLPLGSKIKNVIPFLRIVLTNHYKYEEIIQEKIKKEDVEADLARQRKQIKESNEAYEYEQAKKMADERKARAEEYYKYQEKSQKRKGFISSVLFLIVIGLWIFNLFQRFDFRDIYSMRKGISSALTNTYTDLDPKDFYTKFNQDLIVNTNDKEQYSFFSLNYIWSEAILVMKKFKRVPCEASNDYINLHYNQENAACIDPSEYDKEPFVANGVTYTYQSNIPDSVDLGVRKGSFDLTGYRMRVEFGNSGNNIEMGDQIGYFSDPFAAEFYSFNFVVYNPSLQKMACVYRVTNQFNRDIKTSQNFIFIFNKSEKSKANSACENIVLAIACLLLLALIFDLFQLLPESKEGFDIELLCLKMKNKDDPQAAQFQAFQVKTKFKVFRACGFIVKVYPPNASFFLNLITVILIIVEGSLDFSLRDRVKQVKFEPGKPVNCSGLIQANHIDTIISAILVLLLMLALLRYLSQFIPFLARFVRILKKLVRNAFTLGLVIVVLFLMLAAYGVFTFGPYFSFLSNFSYFYTAVVLFVMKRNIVFEDDEEGVRYRMMSSNIGTYSFNMLIIFTYIVLSFLIVKVIIAIVLKSIKETHHTLRNENQETKARYEHALALIRDKFFEEYRTNMRNKKID